MKSTIWLKKPGSEIKVTLGCSLLIVRPDPGEVSLDVPLDRKAGQRFGQITTDPS
jgi:hypothetical protein